MKHDRKRLTLVDAHTLARLAGEAVLRLDPRALACNPVMFVVGVGTLVTLWLTGADLLAGRPWGFDLAISLILLFTLLFANAAEALAEARGRAQAESLRSTREKLVARRLQGDREEQVPATALRPGDRVRVRAGELIPADGEIVEGAASVNESAVTGESAPVLREAGTDNSGVSAGTKLLSDSIIVEVRVESGQSLLDRMIALVESAKRQKTPNEIALTVLLAALTMVFLIVVATLLPFAHFVGSSVSVPVLVALLVCLIPTKPPSWWSGWRAAARRRWWSPRTIGCSASCRCRTSSSPTSRNASSACTAWACAPC